MISSRGLFLRKVKRHCRPDTKHKSYFMNGWCILNPPNSKMKWNLLRVNTNRLNIVRRWLEVNAGSCIQVIHAWRVEWEVCFTQVSSAQVSCLVPPPHTHTGSWSHLESAGERCSMFHKWFTNGSVWFVMCGSFEWYSLKITPVLLLAICVSHWSIKIVWWAKN